MCVECVCMCVCVCVCECECVSICIRYYLLFRRACDLSLGEHLNCDL